MTISTRTLTITRDIDAPAQAVWDVLTDGWLYPVWVVGAARMRDVDPTWPAIGAELQHSVGSWPFLLDDRTEVLDMVPGRSLRLKAHAWPTGAAEVLLEIESRGSGSRVLIREDAIEGPGALVPKPLRQLALERRNKETLRRLAYLAEGR
ncbi:MAG: hypothetical protein JWQ32_568 [Marmoricola sp.]|nr:hypothetical protein [Marmoricola sp.]